MWIVAEPLRIEEARAVLKDAVPKLDRYLADSRGGRNEADTKKAQRGV